jgi:LPXTG-motif cell wall-anchored protein
VGGFTPGEFVQLIVASTPQVIGSGFADAQGFVTLTGTIPVDLSSGSHTLAVFAPASGVGFKQPITVSGLSLPATGSNYNGVLILALLAVVAGAVVVVRRQRFVA